MKIKQIKVSVKVHEKLARIAMTRTAKKGERITIGDVVSTMLAFYIAKTGGDKK